MLIIYQEKTGAGVDEAFSLAIECMEEPEELAKSFRSDLLPPNPNSWMETKVNTS